VGKRLGVRLAARPRTNLPRAPELFRTYVDEAGDRGWGGRASPTFVLSAVTVRDTEADALRAMRDQICIDLGKPTSTVLHWAENIKQHSQRKHVARLIAASPATVSNVIVLKQAMVGSGTHLSDPAAMYNYAIRRLLERVTWYVRGNGGETAITFAHIKRFPYAKLRSYLEILRLQATEIVWDKIKSTKIDQPNRVKLLQVADIAAGCLYSAVNPDAYGDYEPSYLLELAPRIYIRGGGRVRSYGMNVVGPRGHMEATYPWWPELVAACEK
jgi:hypothetical protein